MKPTFYKGIVLGAVVSMLVLVASSAIAGTGLGGIFNLGESNTVDATSGLSGAVLGPQLQVTNNGTGASSQSIAGVNNSTTAAAVFARNNGGGPAAAFSVLAGKAPFAVGSTGKVNFLNSDLLDGLDATAFLPATGKAADANLLDGVDSTGFYASGSKVADSNLLDGRDSSSFAPNAMYVLTKTTDGSANASGTCPSGDLCFAGGYYCDTGDVMVSGGFSEIDNGTRLVASEPFTPNPQDTWRVKFVNNSTEDTIQVHTICLDNPPAH
ncbi:MAG: hypothetical protein M3R70_09975 [Actinomycetota bacterium]|nr:hypothetical protein [Actinomycetota bacterium]